MSTVERITTASGHERFQRNWKAASPRAALLLVHGVAEHSGRYEHVGDAFAAAGISGGSPMRTGWAAVKLSAAGFLVPYMFVYSDQLLLVNAGWAEGLGLAVTAAAGLCEGL